jgi:hypothetical protein
MGKEMALAFVLFKKIVARKLDIHVLACQSFLFVCVESKLWFLCAVIGGDGDFQEADRS